MGYLGQRRPRGFGFIRQRIFVVERLIIFRGARKLTRCFVRLSALQQKSRAGIGGGVGVERFDSLFGVAGVQRRGSIGFEKLFAHGARRIILLESLHVGERAGQVFLRTPGLRGPEQNIFAK